MDSNTGNLNEIKKAAIKNKKLIIVVIITVAAALISVGMYNAQNILLKKIKQAKKQETIKLAHLGDIKKIVLSIRDLEKHFYGSGTASEDVMNKIAEYMKTHNIAIVSMKPSEINKGNVSFYNFNIKLKSNFVNLLSFLREIEETDKIFIIKELNMQQAGFSNSDNLQTVYFGKDNLDVSLVLETCVLQEAY